MKERPILMSAPMVQATLRSVDPKTQTRRAVKWRGLEPGLNLQFTGLEVQRSGSAWVLASPTRTSSEYRSGPMLCPYGKPGDRLWVREGYWADATTKEFKWYVNDIFTPDRVRDHCRLIPSIHMPRKLSRLLLEIVAVRVERLLDISEADAIAEGIEQLSPGQWRDYGDPTDSCFDPISSFRTLWESINGFQSSKDNPFVWVVEFKRITH